MLYNSLLILFCRIQNTIQKEKSNVHVDKISAMYCGVGGREISVGILHALVIPLPPSLNIMFVISFYSVLIGMLQRKRLRLSFFLFDHYFNKNFI